MAGRDDDGGMPREVTLTLALPSWPEARSKCPAPSTQRDGWSRSAGEDVFATLAHSPDRHDADGDDESVLALVDRPRTGAMPALDLGNEMRERHALGDFSGALEAAERILKREPNHVLADTIARDARAKLEGLLYARLDVLGETPELVPDAVDRRWLSLDPNVAALLPWIDGKRRARRVVAASGLTSIAALRALLDLVEARVVRLV